eukprot:scaffold164848_cov48-Prasinocladus_malaysianus.AAC.4
MQHGTSSSTKPGPSGVKFWSKGQSSPPAAAPQPPKPSEMRLTSQLLADHERVYRVRDREPVAA